VALTGTRVVRDLYGRISILVPDTLGDALIEELRKEISESLGHYAAQPEILIRRFEDALDPEALRMIHGRCRCQVTRQ
jgi:hypothetical protein